MNVTVILPAAGRGERFGAADDGPSKIEHELAGKPIFLRAAELFLARADVGQVILAVHPDRLDAFSFRWGDKLRFLNIQLVAGGTVERWQTVARALEHVRDGATHVAVHDAARPLTSPALVDRVFDAAARHPAVIPGLPVSNTLKRVEPVEPTPAERDPLDAILGTADKPAAAMHRVVETVDRRELVEVQTPQVFEVSLLRRAYADVADHVTDDAALVEALGEPVMVVEGDPLNLKITRPPDLELAAALLEKRQAAQAADLAKKRLFGDDDED